MKHLARQLREILNRFQATSFTRDRAAILEDAIPILRRCITAIEQFPRPVQTELEHAVIRLLTCVQQNRVIHKGDYHISNPAEFTQVIHELERLQGKVEDLELWSGPTIK